MMQQKPRFPWSCRSKSIDICTNSDEPQLMSVIDVSVNNEAHSRRQYSTQHTALYTFFHALELLVAVVAMVIKTLRV